MIQFLYPMVTKEIWHSSTLLSFFLLSSSFLTPRPPSSSWYVVICRDDDLLISAGGMFDKQAAAGTHSGSNLTWSVIRSWLNAQRLGLWHCRATGWLMLPFHLILFHFFVYLNIWDVIPWLQYSKLLKKKIQSIPDIRKSSETADDSCFDPHLWQWGKFIEWILFSQVPLLGQFHQAMVAWPNVAVQ